MDSEFPERVVHGGIGKLLQEKGCKTFLDFSASVNPFPPRFDWSCNPEALACYPDDNYSRLKDAIAASYHRNPEEICVGNGSIELIRVFCAVVLRGNRTFTYEKPTFGEYDCSARLAGGVFMPKSEDAAVIFACNPNNPTGLLRTKEELVRTLAHRPDHGFLFCDEAFIDLSNPEQSLSDISDPRLFVLQSLTKSFAVPGIRFGFGFADPDLVAKIEISRPPWSVNAFAESFAIAALRYRDDLEDSRHRINVSRIQLEKELSNLGLKPQPSHVNYLLVECGTDVFPLCERLMKEGILVRDCTSFGLPTCIRIAVRTDSENRALLEALQACLP